MFGFNIWWKLTHRSHNKQSPIDLYLRIITADQCKMKPLWTEYIPTIYTGNNMTHASFNHRHLLYHIYTGQCPSVASTCPSPHLESQSLMAKKITYLSTSQKLHLNVCIFGHNPTSWCFLGSGKVNWIQQKSLDLQTGAAPISQWTRKFKLKLLYLTFTSEINTHTRKKIQ